MPSASDTRAALLLLVLALLGLGVRLFWQGGSAGGVAYHATAALRPDRDSVAARAARLARPLRAGERIDVDRASAEELTRLPRLGPGLALRIVADRAERGPFGSLDALGRVAGIGPGTLAVLEPHVSFSAPATAAPQGSSAGWGGEARLLVILNTAPAESLTQLPGIGPARARAIVEERRAAPYRSLDDLRRVPGIGPATIQRLRDRARVP